MSWGIVINVKMVKIVKDYYERIVCDEYTIQKIINDKVKLSKQYITPSLLLIDSQTY